MAVQKAYILEGLEPPQKFELWSPRKVTLYAGKVVSREFVEYKRNSKLIGRLGLKYSKEIDYKELKSCFDENFAKLFSPDDSSKAWVLGHGLSRSSDHIPYVADEESIIKAHNAAIEYCVTDHEFENYEDYYWMGSMASEGLVFQKDQSEELMPVSFRYINKWLPDGSENPTIYLYPAVKSQKPYNTINNPLNIEKIEELSEIPTEEQKEICRSLVNEENLRIIDELVEVNSKSLMYALMLVITEKHKKLLELQNKLGYSIYGGKLYRDEESYVDAVRGVYKQDRKIYKQLKFLENAWEIIVEKLDQKYQNI